MNLLALCQALKSLCALARAGCKPETFHEVECGVWVGSNASSSLSTLPDSFLEPYWYSTDRVASLVALGNKREYRSGFILAEMC